MNSSSILCSLTNHTLADRYNPSNVGILEDYLYHQIRSDEYDCLSNLAILKLYVSLVSLTSLAFTIFETATNLILTCSTRMLS